MKIVYETLDKKLHNRADFECKDRKLTDFLKTNASQNQTGSFSRTHVAVEQGAEPLKTIYGYYTLVSNSLDLSMFEDNLKRSPTNLIPTIKIARLARNDLYTKAGFGEHLLISAMHKVLHLANNEIGIYAVELDVTHEKTKAFYKKFGFTEFKSKPNSLFISGISYSCCLCGKTNTKKHRFGKCQLESCAVKYRTFKRFTGKFKTVC